MNEEEKNKLVKEICEGLQVATELGINAMMNMILDTLIKLVTIPDVSQKILFLTTIQKEINKKEENN